MSSVGSTAYQICLEGNIGAGKSTILNFFSQQDGFEILPETLNLWRTLPLPTSGTHNLLDSFYKDPASHTFPFQSYVMLTKVEQQLHPSPHPVKILERGLHSVFHIFSRALHQEGFFKEVEYAVHAEWHRHFSAHHAQMMPDMFIWLKTDPEVNFHRVQLRGREEEAGITKEYLALLGQLHEDWLTQSPFKERTVILDGNQDKTKVLADCKEILKEKIPQEIQAKLAFD